MKLYSFARFFFIVIAKLFFCTQGQAADQSRVEEKTVASQIHSVQDFIDDVRELFAVLDSELYPAPALDANLRPLLDPPHKIIASLLMSPHKERHDELYAALKVAYGNKRYVERIKLYSDEKVRAMIATYDELCGELDMARGAFADAVESVFSKFMHPEIPRAFPRRIDHYLTYKGTNDVIEAKDPNSNITYYLTFEENWGNYVIVGRAFRLTWFEKYFFSMAELKNCDGFAKININWSKLESTQQAMQKANEARSVYFDKMPPEIQLIANSRESFLRNFNDLEKLDTLTRAKRDYLQWWTNRRFSSGRR